MLRIIRRLCGGNATSESRMTRQCRAWLREMGNRRPAGSGRPGCACRPVPGRRSIEYQQQYPQDEQLRPSVRGYSGRWSVGKSPGRQFLRHFIRSRKSRRCGTIRRRVSPSLVMEGTAAVAPPIINDALPSPKDEGRRPFMTAVRVEATGMFLASVWRQAVRRGPKMSNAEFGPARSGRSSPPCILKKQRRRP